MTWAERQKSSCQSQITANNTNIEKYEALYDSITQFKSVVSESKGSFSSVNSNKKKYLSELQPATTNCKTASQYCTGMEKTLNGVGVTCVICAYAGLLLSIDVKQAEYQAKIKALEASNTLLNQRVASLDIQIRREAEAAAQENG